MLNVQIEVRSDQGKPASSLLCGNCESPLTVLPGGQLRCPHCGQVVVAARMDAWFIEALNSVIEARQRLRPPERAA